MKNADNTSIPLVKQYFTVYVLKSVQKKRDEILL